MYLPQFKLSKLAAGIGSVLWFMAYAPHLQAQPRQIAPMIPLASTWPDYGRIATEQLETRVLAAQDANDSAFVRAWRNSTHEGHAEGGPLSSNLPHCAVAAAECEETPPGYTHVPGVGDYPTAYVERCDAERGEGMPGLCEDEGCPHSAVAHVCVEAEPERAWVKSAVDAHAVLGTEFVVDYGTDPDASPGTAEAAVQYAKPKRVLTANETAKVILGEMEPPEGAYMKRTLPKRVRVRTKPLTAADIVEGGEYVPKRGNNKTPNLIVRSVKGVQRKCKEPEVSVLFMRKGDDVRVESATLPEFLALAARRVGA